VLAANAFDVLVSIAEITIPAIIVGIPAIYAAVWAKKTRHEVKTGNGHTAGQAIDNIADTLTDLRSEQSQLQKKVASNQFRNEMQFKIAHARLVEIEKALDQIRREHEEIEGALGIDHEDS
jgi:hypothetical protein